VAGLFYADARQEADPLTADTGVTAPVPLPPGYLGTKTVGEAAGTLIRSATRLGVAPWTSTSAIQYNFGLAEHSAYARANFVYRSHERERYGRIFSRVTVTANF
jgi:hypothetical protein